MQDPSSRNPGPPGHDRGDPRERKAGASNPFDASGASNPFDASGASEASNQPGASNSSSSQSRPFDPRDLWLTERAAGAVDPHSPAHRERVHDDPAARARFAELMRLPDAAIPLAEACLLIARAAEPAPDEAATIATLEMLAARVRASLPDGFELQEPATARTIPRDFGVVLDALHRVLYDELGLRGAPRHLLDPRTSYLHEVLTQHVGLPIIVSIVELEVAWRLGLPLHGVGLPGHFIIGGPDGLFVDPCDRGRILTRDDCQALIRQATGRPVLLRPHMLQAATRREILARVLGNLRGIFLANRDWRGALWTLELLVLIDPRDPGLRRDRALLYGRVGRFSDAVRGLEQYLEELPHASDRDEVAHARGIFSGRRN